MDDMTRKRVEGFVADGFLSDGMSDWKSEWVAKNKIWFEFIGDLNRLMQTIVINAEFTVADESAERQVTTSAGLFIRSISSFQASILLLQNGLLVEAKTLLRSLFETTFYICALQRLGEPMVDRIVNENNHARYDLGQSLLKSPAYLALTTKEEVDQVKTFIAECDADETFCTSYPNFRKRANNAGLQALYLDYKRLSFEAAHPGVESISSYYDEKSSEETGAPYFVLWPSHDISEAARTLSFAADAILLCAVAHTKIAGTTAFNTKMTTIKARLDSMEESLK